MGYTLRLRLSSSISGSEPLMLCMNCCTVSERQCFKAAIVLARTFSSIGFSIFKEKKLFLSAAQFLSASLHKQQTLGSMQPQKNFVFASPKCDVRTSSHSSGHLPPYTPLQERNKRLWASDLYQAFTLG